MKHTPGPWNLIETTHEKIVSSWDVEIGEHLVSVFPYKRIYSDDRAQSGLVIDQEKMSNARLIAAAPDLLESLKLIVSLPGFEPDETYGKQAIAAIAKAEAA